MARPKKNLEETAESKKYIIPDNESGAFLTAEDVNEFLSLDSEARKNWCDAKGITFLDVFLNLTQLQRVDFLRNEESREELRQAQSTKHLKTNFTDAIVLKYRMTLTEPMLGTLPNNPEIYSTYIASKAPDGKNIEEEIASVGVDSVINKDTTVFARTADGTPCIRDYVIMGALKESAGAVKRSGTATPGAEVTAHKKVIDLNVRVYPHKIKLNLPEGEELTILERPLRVQTPQGERVGLARSEQAPIGTYFQFSIVVLNPNSVPPIKEWMQYIADRGNGQWRNAGYGRCIMELLSEDIITNIEDTVLEL
jgi:hypothetical protein